MYLKRFVLKWLNVSEALCTVLR